MITFFVFDVKFIFQEPLTTTSLTHFKVVLLTDVQPYDREVLHLSISTKTYWWHQLLSNGGNLFVHLIIKELKKRKVLCTVLSCVIKDRFFMTSFTIIIVPCTMHVDCKYKILLINFSPCTLYR